MDDFDSQISAARDAADAKLSMIGWPVRAIGASPLPAVTEALCRALNSARLELAEAGDQLHEMRRALAENEARCNVAIRQINELIVAMPDTQPPKLAKAA